MKKLETQPITKQMEDVCKVENLYCRSFPAEERAPFAYLVKPYNNVEFTAFYDGKQFVGLMYLVLHVDICYIFYLAVDEQFRGCGYGSAILDYIREKHPASRIILEIEEADETASNNHERTQRRQFYLKNGYRAMHVHIRQFGIPMEVMAFGGDITQTEYMQLWKEIMQSFADENDNVEDFLEEMFS